MRINEGGGVQRADLTTEAKSENEELLTKKQEPTGNTPFGTTHHPHG
jgi:hypothetical protein